MTTQKKFLPKLYPVKKEIEKTWFVLYYNHEGKRQKAYGNLNHLRTVKERETAAAAIIANLIATNAAHAPVKETTYKLIEDLEAVIDLHSEQWAKKTVQAYHTHLYRFAGWYKAAGSPVADIIMAQQFLNDVTVKGASATTRNNYRNNLKTLWGWLIKYKGYKLNIFKEVKKITESRQTKEWIRPAQVKEIIDFLAVADKQLLLAVKLSFHCFPRPNELRLIRLKNIVWETNRLQIASAFSKTKKTRYVPIPERLLAELEQYKNLNPNYFLFGSDGRPGEMATARDNLSKRHKKFMERLGYSDLVFYGWKNTGAVKMLCHDLHNIRYISKCMGHHSLDMTDKYFESLGVDDMGMSIVFPSV